MICSRYPSYSKGLVTGRQIAPQATWLRATNVIRYRRIGGFVLAMAKAKRAKIKILIADDEPQITVALARQAKAFGLEPITDNPAESLFKPAQQHHPPSILFHVMHR